ncbi:MAG: hypothetical protein JWQ98_2165 [Chlorobi bacterium]|nr:hypothetical protein [Chlorobiota bacterium]
MIYTSTSIQPRRAVVLFVRNERSEALVKPLPRRYRAEGYAALNRRIVARLRGLFGGDTDLVVVGGSTPDGAAHFLPQHGFGFGERIANAITDTAALGYGDIVVIGNDCPTITPQDILSAFDRLRAGAGVVAAPASDGGAFLIAARAEALDIPSFLRLPWCTPRLFASLLEMPGADRLVVVRPDFDSWNDLRAHRALCLLFGGHADGSSRALPSSPPVHASRRKALTRIFLTAPPLI